MSEAIVDKQWLTLHRQKVDNILLEIGRLCAEGDRVVHIGTDAQKHGKRMDFVTAVVVLNPGKGGRVFYTKSKNPNIHSLQHKLFTEVGLSLEIAIALCEAVPELQDRIEVHVDANTNLRHDSANFHQSLAGMVVGHGFKAVLKPDAWCASHVADHAVNFKNHPVSGMKRKVRKASRKM